MARKREKKDRSELLKSVREKLESTDIGSGGGRNFWKPKVGTNVIRIIPGVGLMEEEGTYFFQTVGTHYLGKNNVITCPDFTIDEPCPICEYVKELYAEGSDESKSLASNIRMRKSYWMNIISREEEEKGPQIYTPGVTVFGSIAGIVQDPEYGDIWDEETGIDLKIQRTGTGLDTEYEVRTSRFDSPLAVDSQGNIDEGKIDEWFDKVYDLYPVILSMDPSEDKELSQDEEGRPYPVTVLPYERIKNMMDNMSDLEADSDDVDEDTDTDTEEESDIRKQIRSRRRRR